MKTSSNREQQLFLVAGGAILFLILAVVVFNMISTPSPVPEELAKPISKVNIADAQIAAAVKEANNPWKINNESNTILPEAPPPDNSVYLAPKEVRLPSQSGSEAAADPLGNARQLLEPTPALPPGPGNNVAKPPAAHNPSNVPAHNDVAVEPARTEAEPHPATATPAPRPQQVEKPVNKQQQPSPTMSAPAKTVKPVAAIPPATPAAPQATVHEPANKAARVTTPQVIPEPANKTTRVASPQVIPPNEPQKPAQPTTKPAPAAKIDYSEAITQVIARQFNQAETSGAAKPTVKPTTATASPAPVKPSGSSFQIQIASFATADKAKMMADKVGSVTFQGRRMPVSQTSATVSGKTYFRVRAGPFVSRNNAEAALQSLGQAGIAGSIVSLD
ncbi:MAG: SPOR domain-containing protein [Magnetococcales bacterium]|nr:SPOR domain-containing protein [Magnetococcales bacterium]MBF0149908.1 SPOR domain-containing protein [Magnetococcales bacterium]MBF0174921.1 SPOR domain-containing protein [Magnetococcales bacterium]MBF0346563.1 SPOR domain-containing protein [Magnetococcales bacterium]